LSKDRLGEEAMSPLWREIEHRHLKPALRRFKPLVRRIEPYVAPWRRTTFAGVEVYSQRHLDGGGSGFGQDYIRLFQKLGVPRQGRIFEWCAGPGFIGFSLLAHGFGETLCLADVNPHAIAACRRTVARNDLADRVSLYVSDNLGGIPSSERWDLVVGNPPHFIDDMIGDLRGHDPDWRIHRAFFDSVGRHLNAGGMIVLQENNRGSTVETFRSMIESAGLSVVFTQLDSPVRTPKDHFYFIGIARRGEQPPAWARL
jgi:methylase of polypeptide subunit release factors